MKPPDIAYISNHGLAELAIAMCRLYWEHLCSDRHLDRDNDGVHVRIGVRDEQKSYHELAENTFGTDLGPQSLRLERLTAATAQLVELVDTTGINSADIIPDANSSVFCGQRGGVFAIGRHRPLSDQERTAYVIAAVSGCSQVWADALAHFLANHYAALWVMREDARSAWSLPPI